VKCNVGHAELIEFLYIIILGLFIYIISRLRDAVFDSVLVKSSPILLLHHSLTHAAMVIRPNWRGGEKPLGTGRVVRPSARQ
jgi:hypothetical protein